MLDRSCYLYAVQCTLLTGVFITGLVLKHTHSVATNTRIETAVAKGFLRIETVKQAMDRIIETVE